MPSTSRPTSSALFKAAQHHIPGGVNSPVRAFHGVGGDPVFFKSARGAYLFDVDDQQYIDYVASWGPMVAGHNHPQVIEAVQSAIKRSLGFGAPTQIEVEMADLVCKLVPSMDMVRMVNSGTEATMTALRLARGYTGRDNIIKFEGCYHGHSDSLLVKAGSGALTLGIPTSPGVPAALANHTITLSYNDLEQVEQTFADMGDSIAAIIIEPVAGNMNCIPPVDGFLQGLRSLCDQYGTVLIFDEVMTGFRTALGGAQSVYNITPDLTTLGKIIGGGMPVGAFGGKREIMEKIAPLGPVYQAGTLSGNPIAMTAGLQTLKIIQQEGFYESLTAMTHKLVSGICASAKTHNIAMTSNQVGAMFGLFFTEEKNVSRFAQANACDINLFKKFFHGMLDKGIYIAPSAYETGFVSSAHTEADIEQTIQAADNVFSNLN